MVVIAVPYFEEIFVLCTMKVNLALGSTTVWPKLHLLLCSSITRLCNIELKHKHLEWHDAITRQIVWKRNHKQQCFKYHWYLENLISYRTYCDDITIAKIILSEWVILPVTATTRFYDSYIQNGGQDFGDS